MLMPRSPQRIQLSRAKGWRLPEGAISVARPTRWGNIYVVGEDVVIHTRAHGKTVGLYQPGGLWWGGEVDWKLTREMAVVAYRQQLVWALSDGAIEDDDDDEMMEMREAFEGLRGHDLACWCPLDVPCHADVLLEFANR